MKINDGIWILNDGEYEHGLGFRILSINENSVLCSVYRVKYNDNNEVSSIENSPQDDVIFRGTVYIPENCIHYTEDMLALMEL